MSGKKTCEHGALIDDPCVECDEERSGSSFTAPSATNTKSECKSCGDTYHRVQEPQYNGEVLITGLRSKEDFAIASGMYERFKSWEGRNVISKEGLSVAMQEEVLFNGQPYREAFCHSDNGRIVIYLQPVNGFTAKDGVRRLMVKVSDFFKWGNTCILVAFCLAAISLQAVDVRFSWNANPEEGILYKLSLGSSSGSYSNSISTTNTTVIASNLPIGATYLSVVAINRDGVESDYSDEVVFTNDATNRFIIILSAGSIAQTGAVNEILKSKNWEILNKIDGTWFVMGEDITSRELSEELTGHPLIGGKVKLVIRVYSDGQMTYWGNAPKEVWTWMAKFWGKKSG